MALFWAVSGALMCTQCRNQKKRPYLGLDGAKRDSGATLSPTNPLCGWSWHHPLPTSENPTAPIHRTTMRVTSPGKSDTMQITAAQCAGSADPSFILVSLHLSLDPGGAPLDAVRGRSGPFPAAFGPSGPVSARLSAVIPLRCRGTRRPTRARLRARDRGPGVRVGHHWGSPPPKFEARAGAGTRAPDNTHPSRECLVLLVVACLVYGERGEGVLRTWSLSPTQTP